jgi:hypothetical protein
MPERARRGEEDGGKVSEKERMREFGLHVLKDPIAHKSRATCCADAVGILSCYCSLSLLRILTICTSNTSCFRV